ncbi:MAG: hypothetical protein AAGA18_02950 [Verrucomicrobiota bacterium]
MNFFSKPTFLIIVGLGLTVSLMTVSAQKASNSSLTDKDKVKKLRQQVLQLQESLMMAKADADLFQEKLAEMKLQNRALGLEGLSADEQAMRGKLIRLVGQLHQSEKRRIHTEKLLTDLIKAASAYHGATALEKAEKRAEYEVIVREAREFLAGNPLGAVRPALDLGSGQVIHVDQEIETVVINLGKKQGARIGMPFKILRGQSVVGKCRIVETREYLSAALIEPGEKNNEINVQVGDRLLVDAIR